MVIINLLPWRDELRIYRRKNILKILLFTFLWDAFFVIFLLYYLSYELEKLEIINHTLQAQLKSKERVLTQEQKQNQKQGQAIFEPEIIPPSVMDADNNDRKATRNILISLGVIKHTHVCFQQIMRKKHHYFFGGYTDSLADLLELIKAWQEAQLFSSIFVNKIEHKVNDALYFEISAKDAHLTSKHSEPL